MDPNDSSLVVLKNAGPSISQHGKQQASVAYDCEQSWNQPGANLSDYFNYGLDENRWKMYTIQQLQKRVDYLKRERQDRGFSDFTYY